MAGKNYRPHMPAARDLQDGPAVTKQPITNAIKRLLAFPADIPLTYRSLPKKDATHYDILAQVMIEHAKKGSMSHAKEIIERIEGKLAQPIAGDKTNPFIVTVEAAVGKLQNVPDEFLEVIEQALLPHMVEEAEYEEIENDEELSDLA